MNEFLIINIEDETTFCVVGVEETLEEAKEFVKNDEEFCGDRKNLKIYQEVK